MRVRARKVLVAVAMLVTALPFTTAGHARAQFQFGVGIHLGQNRDSLQATQAALAQARLASFRDEVFWHRLETRQGALEFPESLRDLDRLVTDCARQGGRPLLILDYGNRFYDGGGLLSSPAGIAAYARYVRFVVKHFRGRVDQFEVWNEWNIGGGGTAQQRAARQGSPQGYAAVLRAAYAAIKAENPAATVIGGAFAGYDYRWIDAFGRAGGFDTLDGFSAHPYVFAEGSPGSAQSRPARGTPESAMKHLDELKSRIDALAPGRNVPIYVTEAGWPVHQGANGVSDETAAAYLQRFMLLAKSRPWVAGVWWYDLFDDGDDAENKEHRFGLLRRNAAPRPSFQALVDIAPLLASAATPTVEADASGHVTLTGQRADGTRYVATWLATSDFSRERSVRDAGFGARPNIRTESSKDSP